MKSAFIRNLHWIILILVLWKAYASYQEHQQELANLVNEQKSLVTRVTKLKQQNAQAKSFQKNLISSQQRVEEVSRQINQVQRQLPSQVSDTDVMQYFSSIADDLNISNMAREALPKEARDFYYVKKYRLKGSGTYLQFLIFCENLAKSERIFNIHNLVLQRDSQEQKGRFKLVNFETIIETFSYKKPQVN